MSKAKPGDGKVREDVKRAGEALRAASVAYHELVQKDAARTKRHMSAASAEEQWEILHMVSERAKESCITMREAEDHHRAQTSVMSNNLLGQRRRIKDGKIVIIDKVDPTKLADVMEEYGWSDLTPAQQGTMMIRASNPKPGFHDLTDEAKKDYLSGKTE